MEVRKRPTLHHNPNSFLISNTGFKDIKFAAPVILGVNNARSAENDPLDEKSSQNVASYVKELILLTADPSVGTIPCLKGTEKVIPARKLSQLPSFPRHQYQSHGNTVLLVIPTVNERKKAIIEDNIKACAPTGLKVHTITVPVDSDVGEQPYNEAGVAGACNRILNALKRVDDMGSELIAKYAIGNVIVASIENFIQTKDIERPADFGIAIVHNATTGQTCACSSRGVTVPPKYVNRARRFGTDGNDDHGNVTVGQILAARVPGLDKADWHSVLAAISRYELLGEAVKGLSIPW
jgi:non-canonical (house-cleaning) NTP pyrophosphatase